MFLAFITATTWASPAPVASRCARIDWQIWLATCSCGTSPSAVQSFWPLVCCRERLGPSYIARGQLCSYARQCHGSWAHVADTLQFSGGLSPTPFGVVPGGHTAQRRWGQFVVQPRLLRVILCRNCCSAMVVAVLPASTPPAACKARACWQMFTIPCQMGAVPVIVQPVFFSTLAGLPPLSQSASNMSASHVFTVKVTLHNSHARSWGTHSLCSSCVPAARLIP